MLGRLAHARCARGCPVPILGPAAYVWRARAVPHDDVTTVGRDGGADAVARLAGVSDSGLRPFFRPRRPLPSDKGLTVTRVGLRTSPPALWLRCFALIGPEARVAQGCLDFARCIPGSTMPNGAQTRWLLAAQSRAALRSPSLTPHSRSSPPRGGRNLSWPDNGVRARICRCEDVQNGHSSGVRSFLQSIIELGGNPRINQSSRLTRFSLHGTRLAV